MAPPAMEPRGSSSPSSSSSWRESICCTCLTRAPRAQCPISSPGRSRRSPPRFRRPPDRSAPAARARWRSARPSACRTIRACRPSPRWATPISSPQCGSRFRDRRGRRPRGGARSTTTRAGSARNFLEKGLWIDLTVGEALRRTAARVPERIAFASEEGELTFRQLDERSERLGAALLDLGVQPGERAMFQMGTVLDTVVALTACYKAGIIPVCSVPQYREVEIGQLARLSGATLYFVQADFGSFDLVGFARGMQGKGPSLRHLIVAPGRADDPKPLIPSIR